MLKIVRVLTACLVLAFAVVACGGGGSDEDQIKDVTSDLASAFEDKDWDQVCELFSSKAKRQLEAAGALLGGKGCEDTIGKAAAFAGDDDALDFGNVEATNVKVTGNTATADTGDETTHYVKEDGDWKIDADPADEDTSSSSSSSGDADEDVEAAPAPELRVAEQGVTNTGEGASYGLIVENPSTDTDAVEVEVTINLVGGGDDIVKTETQNLIGVPAGEQVAVGGESDTSGDRVRRMDVTVTASEGAAAGELTLPEASRAKILRDEFGFTTVRVQVHNTMDTPLSAITDVFAVLRDSSGKIVGGVSGYPEADIQPGARAAVELVSFADVSQATSADASADGESAP
jgi:hypothetical protein